MTGLRAAVASDEPALRRALFLAWRWREARPSDAAWNEYLAERRAEPLVDGFGTADGDLGVIALADAGSHAGSDADPLGAAWARRVDRADPGFVADDIPVLAIAVEPAARGRGLGPVLLDALVRAADAAGVRALSLHVSAENRHAARLYERAGFEDAEPVTPASGTASARRGRVLVRPLGRMVDGLPRLAAAHCTPGDAGHDDTEGAP